MKQKLENSIYKKNSCLLFILFFEWGSFPQQWWLFLKKPIKSEIFSVLPFLNSFHCLQLMYKLSNKNVHCITSLYDVSFYFDFFFVLSATSLGKKHRNYMYVYLIHVRPRQLHKNRMNIVLVDIRTSGFLNYKL